MGTVVQFPVRRGGTFTPEMRSSLAHLAAWTPGLRPLLFGTDGDGSEFCCLANGLMVGWDRERRLVLTDTLSGYVDRGPFYGLAEVCCIIAGLKI
jgi:hypothetical protein